MSIQPTPSTLDKGRLIEIDDEVFAELQRQATPLVDDANSVLRRVLDLGGSSTGLELSPADRGSAPPRRKPPGKAPTPAPLRGRKKSAKGKSAPKQKRAPKGSLLPEQAYERPLLVVLEEAGGSGPSAEILDALGEKLGAKLTDADRETINSGDIRWRNRAQFVRLSLVKQGLMVKDSPRGTWAISDNGRDFLQRSGSDG